MGRKIIDLRGQVIGRLTVLEEAGRAKDGKVLWLCKCECGKEAIVTSSNLKSWKTQSCGCLQKDRARECVTERNTKHGLSVSHRKLCEAIRVHFRFIKNAVGCYGDWEIDPRYTPDYMGVIKFCEDLIASRPDECARYERDRSLEIDKDTDRDHIFRPESIVFVSHTENNNNRKCTLRLEDGTPLTDFCRSLGIETCNQTTHKSSKQYVKYHKWFKNHKGEAHPELLKKANELVALYSKCLKLLKLRDEARQLAEQVKAL